MKKNPKKPARLWAVWSPTKGYYSIYTRGPKPVETHETAKEAREAQHYIKAYKDSGVTDWRVVPVRLVKITPRRGRRSK